MDDKKRRNDNGRVSSQNEDHCDAFASAGNIIFEEDQVVHILAGLGSDYDSFVVSMTSQFETVRLPDLCAMLLAHECILDQSATPEPMTVNLMQGKETQQKRFLSGNHYNP